jgi:hypothetical protein
VIALIAFAGAIAATPIDTAAHRNWFHEYMAERVNLRSALTTRILTEAEMSRVLDAGYQIFMDPGFPYREEDKQSEFLYALKVQALLRSMNTGCPEVTP